MLDREMTPSEAIIILDRLNTSERISVDRDELRAAVIVAKKGIRKLEHKKPLGKFELLPGITGGLCPICANAVASYEGLCNKCGQALDWSEI